MTVNVIQVASGKASCSPISYYCDLSRRSGPVMPLGVILELKLSNIRALGMIARTRLTDYELSLMGQRARELLANPFDHLSYEFDDAWDDAPPGQALEFLSRRHAHALHFAAPVNLEIPKRLRIGVTRVAVRQFLSEVLEEESYSLTPLVDDPSSPQMPYIPQQDLIETELGVAA